VLSENMEILIIWYLSSPKPETCSFYQKKASSVKQADLKNTFKKAYRSVCTSTVVHPDPLSPILSTSSATKTPKNTERALMTLD
jgi:hypothetical protein